MNWGNLDKLEAKTATEGGAAIALVLFTLIYVFTHC